MNRVAPVVAAQVPVERRADVIQFVEQGDQLLVEVQLEKSRQAERNQVEDFVTVHKIALHLVGHATALARQPAAMEPQRRDTRLQSVGVPVASLSNSKKDSREIEVAQRIDA